ncbi:MAG: DUF308 domain-containing protein [Microbacteriaceae bacterium]|nr:DUF308 domain-containing protein [Microbacteriaceae bacterium]
MLPPWMIPAGRAVLAIALGLVITFSQAHTAGFGLVVFGGYAVLAGAFLLLAWFGPRAPERARTAFQAQGVVTVLAGIAALVQPAGGMAYFVWVLSGWAIVTGALETVSGIRYRGSAPEWTDWVVTGVLTIALGAIALVLPPDIADVFATPDESVLGMLTSPIIVIGLLGGWAVITGVLQAIGAATPVIARRRTVAAPSAARTR